MNRSKVLCVAILFSASVGLCIGWWLRPPPKAPINGEIKETSEPQALGATSHTQRIGVLVSPNNSKLFANVSQNNGLIVVSVLSEGDDVMGLMKTKYGATFPMEVGWFVMIDGFGNTYYGVDGKWVSRIKEIGGKVKIISLMGKEKARVFEALSS